MLTRDMAVKLAHDGIRVNAIAPGAFDTPMIDYAKVDEATLHLVVDGGCLVRA